MNRTLMLLSLILSAGAPALAAPPAAAPGSMARPAAESSSGPELELTAALGSGPLGGIVSQAGPIGSVNLLIGGDDTVASIGLAGGIGFFVNPTLEIMLNPSFTLISSGGTATILSFTAGPLFNFSEPVKDSAFVYVGPGLSLLKAGNSTNTNFEFTVAFGKRFSLGGRISYSPVVGYTGVLADPYLSGIGITPVQFSLFF